MNHPDQCPADTICLFHHVSIQSEERFGKNLITQIVDHPGTNIFVESQLPAFVREDHPRFVTFLEAYYKWLDQNSNVGGKIRKIREQQDIDEASEEFIEHFYKEFLVNVPRNVLVNKKVLLKYIRQFYRAKGTEKSYRLFFRMLYDTNVDFYYPSKDIFKLSDGKWVQRKVIRVFSQNATAQDFFNKKIIGRQNGMIAFVTEVHEILVDGLIVYELVLNTSSISGTFLPNETIVTEDGNFFARISPIPTTYNFAYDSMQNKKTGKGYKVGDTFKILNDVGRGGRIKVTSIIPTKKVQTEVLITPAGDNTAVSNINLGKKNLVGVVSIICAKDTNYQKLPLAAPGWDSDGTQNESVKYLFDLKSDVDGNINLVLKQSYAKPAGRVRVEYEYSIEDDTGEVEHLQIVNFGIEYSKYENESLRTFSIELNEQSCVSKNFTGDGQAKLILSSNAVGTYSGFYSNEDGHLSSSKYIQDGEYYQQYSYVTIVNQPTSDYVEALKRMVHPIGFKFFGKFRPQIRLGMLSRIAPKSQYSNTHREFKQFHRPDSPQKNPPLLATPKVKTSVALVKQTTRERSSYGLGPSNNSLFRERFNYKPNENYYSAKEVNSYNSDYWGDPNVLASQFANTSIDKFAHMIPVTLEGVSQSTRRNLMSVTDSQKRHMNPKRCDLIYNSTFNIVEMYDDDSCRWIEIAPNRRINMLPDSVVTTTGIMVSNSGDLELKLTSVRSIETLGKPKVGLL